MRTHLQDREGRGLGGRGPLELGEPVPGLPGVPADLAEESLHVPVDQGPVRRHVSLRGGGAPRVLLLGQSRGFASLPGRVRAHHAGVRTQQPPLPQPGALGRDTRAGQVLPRQDHGPTAAGAGVCFGHAAGHGAAGHGAPSRGLSGSWGRGRGGRLPG